LFGLCGIKQTKWYENENQTDWDTLLPFASFSFNNSVHESTGYSHFHLNYGLYVRVAKCKYRESAQVLKIIFHEHRNLFNLCYGNRLW
jgi:hypothetical protein